MPTGNVYTPQEIYATIKAEADRRGARNPNLIRMTYIVLRESGGDARAYRDASKNPNGGNDRGWYQFNSKYHPDVTDMIAYDPKAATAKAYEKSDGFTNFDIWRTSRDPNFGGRGGDEATRASRMAAEAKAYEGAGYLVKDAEEAVMSGAEQVGELVGKVTPDWASGLGSALGWITTADNWRRIGIGALAAAIIVTAIVIFFVNTKAGDVAIAGATKGVVKP